MATDAKFDKIQKILPHDNADTLEIAIVSNFPCVVRKGEFKENEWVFYIRDDAKLIGYDELKEREERDKEAAKTGDFVTQDCFTCSFQWQDPLLKYLGSGGRVKTIKLRGKTSMGIILKTVTVCPNISNFDDVIASYYNKKISDSEYGSTYLEKDFGIKHWTAPQKNVGDLYTLHCGLEDNIPCSDEENYENLDTNDLHLGGVALITKKLDGTSGTVICRPDGSYAVCTRHNTLKPEYDNIYTKYTKEVVNAGLWYAKKYNKVIAFQGEICVSSVQRMNINKDKDLNDYFVYKCYFPENDNYHLKMGTYGTESHFLNVVKECNENGYNVKTVPVLGEETVTMELLKEYSDKPASFGEGVVLNIKCNDINDYSSMVWDYKAKSREYLMKIK